MESVDSWIQNINEVIDLIDFTSEKIEREKRLA